MVVVGVFMLLLGAHFCLFYRQLRLLEEQFDSVTVTA